MLLLMIITLIYHYDPQIFSQMKEMLSTLYKAIMNYKADYNNNLPNHLDTINKLNTQLNHIINNTK
jgi:hypothetical protein